MKIKSIYQPAIAVFVAASFLLFMAVLVLTPAPLTQAAPAAVPTVVAAVDAGTGRGVVIPFQPVTALIADTATTPIEVVNFKTIDIEFTIDQHATVVNTTTLTVQYSIAGSVWEDGVVLATSNAADATDLLVRVPIYGRYIRVNQDVATTDPITISITSVARP